MMLVRRHADVPAFVRSLHLHHSVRLHAAILLIAASLAGLLFSALLRWAGMETPLLRFPVVVVVSYGFFLLFVSWWLNYLGLKRTEIDIPDPGGFPSGSGAGTHAGEPGSMSGVHPGGGTFDGGGASGGFDSAAQGVSVKAEVAARAHAAAVHAALETKAQAAAAAAETTASSSISAADLAGGAAGLGELIPIIILLAVVGVFIAVGGWLVTTTPAMLVDTATDVAVASGLIRSLSRTTSSGWFALLFERSIPKAFALAALAFVVGLAVRWIDPGANTIGQALSRMVH